MKVIKARAGHIETEYDGPPRLIVADVYGGYVTLVVSNHPEDDEREMRTLANRLRTDRQKFDKQGA